MQDVRKLKAEVGAIVDIVDIRVINAENAADWKIILDQVNDVQRKARRIVELLELRK